MGRKSVAVLDVRSAEVTALVGERGVNHTFVLKANRSEPYDGYEAGKFFNLAQLGEAVMSSIAAVERICGERIKTLFIGVPGEFTEVIPKEHEVSFPKRRRIGEREIGLLYESGKENLKGYRFMRASSMIFITSDNRRVVDPTGLSSASLSGILSYFYCSDYFAEAMEEIFKGTGITLRYLPSEYAQAIYLIPSERRDEYALFLDTGYLSSTVCIMLGGGVLAQKTFWAGKGQIAFRLMQRFNLPYDGAVALLDKANLFRKGGVPDSEFLYQGVAYEIPFDDLVEEVRAGLDDICEQVSGFLDECAAKELDYKPLYVTGEGICDIRGAIEHFSKRLNRVCEQIAPDLPYYNKPSVSSRIALADTAYEDNRKRGLLYRLLNGLGG